MNRLRVLLISRALDFGGGVGNFLMMLMKNIPEQVEWEFFRTGEPNPQAPRLRKLVWPLLDNARLFARLRKTSVDCLQLNPSMNWTAFMRDALLLVTARMAGLRSIVVFFHGWDEKFIRKLAENRLYRFVLQRAYGKASIIIVLATRFKEQLVALDMDGNRIRVQTTMFDGSIFQGSRVRDENSARRVLFMSRFVEEKGAFKLLEAFQRVFVAYPDARLIMVGDGPQRDAMERYVAEHELQHAVRFTGYLRGEDKAKVLEDADVFVFPSSYPEGCPISLLEAMAAGLAVVTTAAGGIGEVFTDGENGILLYSDSPDEIFNAISRFFEAAEWQREVGRRNADIAWRQYEADVIARQLEQTYREAIAADGVSN